VNPQGHLKTNTMLWIHGSYWNGSDWKLYHSWLWKGLLKVPVLYTSPTSFLYMATTHHFFLCFPWLLSSYSLSVFHLWWRNQ
jgi:hypothetical protein